MTPFAWFITIWAGFCVFGIIEVIRDWNKEPPKKKTYEETQEWIRITSNNFIGKSMKECRRIMRRMDGHWF